MNKRLKASIDSLPTCPGIYKFKKADGLVLYIGKAKNLKNRVRSYFQSGRHQSVRTNKMISQVEDLEYVEVSSELEAVFLETNLIKELRPRYNVLMKDDKNFAYIKVTTNEDFPRVEIVRKVLRDGARYFGPKTSAMKARDILELLRKLFPIRNCTLGIDFTGLNKSIDKNVKITRKTIAYPCLEYHIKRCVGPCIENCTYDEYRSYTKGVIEFLEGKSEEIQKKIEIDMITAAQAKKFEHAAVLRDKAAKIKHLVEKQSISAPDGISQDYIGVFLFSSKAFFTIFQVRHGKVINQENFICEAYQALDEDKPFLIESFLKQYYEKVSDLPKKICIPLEIGDTALFEKWLSEIVRFSVKVKVPKKARGLKLIKLANENAESFGRQTLAKWEVEDVRTVGACKDLANVLDIANDLNRIECYDISHLGGTETVGSMAVFLKGVASKKDYRHFTLRTIPDAKPDDYASIKEVLRRRLKYLSNQKFSFSVRKIFKKIWPEILSEIRKGQFIQDNLNYKNFYGIWTDGKLCGFGQIINYTDDICEIATLWINPTNRGKKLGYNLITEMIKRQNCRRFYVYSHPNLIEYYAAFGFKPISVIPDEFKTRVQSSCDSAGRKGNLMLLEKKHFYIHKRDESLLKVPDLMIIDGGKGQLSAAKYVLDSLALKIPLIALAKKNEEIFGPNKKDSILLPRDSNALYLVQRLRDEAHRFALKHQRGRRNKRMLGKL